jgi:hypothetical protein
MTQLLNTIKIKKQKKQNWVWLGGLKQYIWVIFSFFDSNSCYLKQGLTLITGYICFLTTIAYTLVSLNAVSKDLQNEEWKSTEILSEPGKACNSGKGPTFGYRFTNVQ